MCWTPSGLQRPEAHQTLLAPALAAPKIYRERWSPGQFTAQPDLAETDIIPHDSTTQGASQLRHPRMASWRRRLPS